MAGLVAFLGGDSGDAAGGETGCASADEFSEATDEFEFGVGWDDAELVLEEVAGFVQVLEGISGFCQYVIYLINGMSLLFNQGQEG